MNNKITCDIINDILPLYVDDALSEDSKTAVMEHLATCSKCRQTVSAMSSDINGLDALEAKDNTFFKQIQKKIRKKIVLRILITIFVVLFIWVASDIYLAVHYAPVNPKALPDYIQECLTVVDIDGSYYIKQDDFFAQGDIVWLSFENGEFKFFLGESGIRSLGLVRSYNTTPKYQHLITPLPDEEVKAIHYCKPDGTIITTLWTDGEPLPQLTER